MCGTNECYTMIEEYYKSRASEFICTVYTTEGNDSFMHSLTCALQFFNVFLCATGVIRDSESANSMFKHQQVY